MSRTQIKQCSKGKLSRRERTVLRCISVHFDCLHLRSYGARSKIYVRNSGVFWWNSTTYSLLRTAINWQPCARNYSSESRTPVRMSMKPASFSPRYVCPDRADYSIDGISIPAVLIRSTIRSLYPRLFAFYLTRDPPLIDL